jgi:hypothetical protein
MQFLRNYDVVLRHAGLFPDLHPTNLSVGRRVFIGYEDLSRLPDKDLYVIASKLHIFHTWCFGVYVVVDLDLAAEIVAKAKLLTATLEHDVNAWIAAYNSGTTPIRLLQENNWTWHPYGPFSTFIPWNYSA